MNYDCAQCLKLAETLEESCGTYETVQVYRTGLGNYYLGTRVHDLGGTDYDYKYMISEEVAKFLVKNGVSNFMNKVPA